MKSFRIIPRVFQFKKPSGTSRGIMTHKKSWFIALSNETSATGWGECSIIENLSPDHNDDEQYFKTLESLLESWKNDTLAYDDMTLFPSMRFGIEMALLDLEKGGRQLLFDTPFSRGDAKIRINGLIWMGSTKSIREQIEEKLNTGFRCIKLKIGAMPWPDEFAILKDLRAAFPAEDIEIRVDANGAYNFHEAPAILANLAALEVHSIEQPIRAGQWDEMAALCASTPCPIALDEELIGVHDQGKQSQLLAHIRPQYIILKPSLHGGISGSQQWISEADRNGIQWWMTSALESNLGLNAIAQLAACYDLQLPQGLGTGSLYDTNIPSPLSLSGEWLSFNPTSAFTLDF